MQYYSNYLKNKNDRFETITVCLNQAVTLCTDRAKALYPCDIILDCPLSPIYVEKKFADIAAEIALVFEKCKNEYNAVRATLKKTEDGKYATFTVSTEDGKINEEKTFLLYTGTPEYVVSDSTSDRPLEKIVEEIFNMLSKC